MTKKGLWLGAFFLCSLSVWADGDFGELAFDEQGLTPGTAVPTITAEGDFLLPTYLLPAGVDLLISTHALNGEVPSVKLVSVEQEKVRKSPAVTEITGGKMKKISLAVAEETTQQDLKKLGEGHKVAENTLERQLIPREEETQPTPVKQPDMQVSDLILKQQMLGQQKGPTQLSGAGSQNARLEQNVPPEASLPAPVKRHVQEQPQPREIPAAKEENLNETRPKPLLVPMGKDVTEEKEEITEEEITPPVRYVVPSRYADQMLSNAGRRQISSTFIMPKEIKVSFYQNAFSLSGQAMKWVKAFSLGAIQDPRVMIEVRISTENRPLQEKRLKLIEQVLVQNGLSWHQLRVVWTQRNPHSVQLRYIERADEDEVIIRRTAKSEKK